MEKMDSESSLDETLVATLRSDVARLTLRVAELEAAAAARNRAEGGAGSEAEEAVDDGAALLTFAVEDDAADDHFRFALSEPQLPYLRANPLCVLLVALPDGASHVLACGSADKSLALSDWRANRTLARVELSAAVLSLAASPRCEPSARLLAAGCMDGAVHVLSLSGACDLALLQTVQCHTRYVVALRWSATGRYLATGSWDHSCVVFALAAEAETVAVESAGAASSSSSSPPLPPSAAVSAIGPLVKVKKFLFGCHVESVEFISTASDKGGGGGGASADVETTDNMLIIAVAESVDLFHVDLPTTAASATSIDDAAGGRGSGCSTWTLRPLNMNARGDSHVSFSAMDLRRCPGDSRLLLVATDKGRVLVLRGGTTQVLRTFVGHTAGDLSHPRVAWSPCGRYALSNTEESGAIVVWSLATARIVRRIGDEDDGDCPASHCHRSAVRSLDVVVEEGGGTDGDGVLIASCAFDKRLKVWKQKGGD